jgi:hypothetical protein
MLGSEQTGKTRQMKSKFKSRIIIFFDIKGTVHKEYNLAG